MGLNRTHYDFGLPTTGVPRPNYRLCWGHDPRGVTRHHVVLVTDQLRLHGPDVTDYVCTLGVACILDITGVGLRPLPARPSPRKT